MKQREAFTRTASTTRTGMFLDYLTFLCNPLVLPLERLLRETVISS